MTVSDRLHRAASRVLDGDDSIAAAQGLEGVLLEEYAFDERVAGLLASVSLYGHEDLDPYVHAAEVRELLMDSLERLGHRCERVELFRRPEGWVFSVFGDAPFEGRLSAVHGRDFAAAREALVSQLRRDYPRVLSLRWSATGEQGWAGQLPG